MAEFKCDSCGTVDHVLLDGYPVGDRLLEGVMFEIRRGANGKYKASTLAEHKSYMASLNEKRWLKAMAEYATDMDIATCPKCHGDIEVSNEQPSRPVAIKLLSPRDLASENQLD